MFLDSSLCSCRSPAQIQSNKPQAAKTELNRRPPVNPTPKPVKWSPQYPWFSFSFRPTPLPRLLPVLVWHKAPPQPTPLYRSTLPMHLPSTASKLMSLCTHSLSLPVKEDRGEHQISSSTEFSETKENEKPTSITLILQGVYKDESQ